MLPTIGGGGDLWGEALARSSWGGAWGAGDQPCVIVVCRIKDLGQD